VTIGNWHARSSRTASSSRYNVNAPLAICEQRDSKGLYKKAREGKIPNFTGVSAPYEPPERPEIEVHTDRQTVAESVAQIIEHLRSSHINRV